MTRPRHAPSTPTSSTPSVFNDGQPLPKILVFDLDYTLWPMWCDTHVTPPLKATTSGSKVKDRYGESYGFYDDVGSLLVQARGKGMKIGAASRTSAPEIARGLLKMLRIPTKAGEGEGAGEEEGGSIAAIDLFDVMEIYPGTKTMHFERIHKRTGLPYEEMLFFDDESRNKNVEQLGVVMKLVRDGVTVKEVENGVQEWRRRNGRKKVKGDDELGAKEEL